MSKRTTVTLPDSVFEEIEDWAAQQGRPTAGLMALLIELGLRDAKQRGEYAPSKDASK
ncbi:MAG: hypothetical protein AAFU78_14900 [Cyanobacteria bacterium J06633_2]